MTPASANRLSPLHADPAARSHRPWVERLAVLAGRLATPLDEKARARDRGELWLLLTAVLSRYTRARTLALGPLAREDIEDLVAGKAFDLLRRIESGALQFRCEAPHEIPAFLARTCHNAIVDLRRRERLRQGGPHTADDAQALLEPETSLRTESSPSGRVEFAEMTHALEHCLEQLAPRARRVWILRTFFEMSSRDIAAHPEVAIKPSHVDVVVSRTRAAVQACLAKRGFEAADFDLVGIARLWDRFVRPAEQNGREP